MRTTITLDPVTARLVEEEMHRTRSSFKEVVNRVLQRGLSGEPAAVEPPPYTVEPHATRLLAGLDPAGFNRLVDELEDAERAAALGRGSG